APRLDEVPGALLYRSQVDGDGAGRTDPEVRPAPSQVGGIGTCDHGLRGGAAHVEAGAADQTPLDDDDALAPAGEPGRQRRRRLSGADDDRVEIFESFVHSRL